jgi:hypothetical protein
MTMKEYLAYSSKWSGRAFYDESKLNSCVRKLATKVNNHKGRDYWIEKVSSRIMVSTSQNAPTLLIISEEQDNARSYLEKSVEELELVEVA